MRTIARPRNDSLWRRRNRSVPITVRPTGSDIAIAGAIARNTKPAPDAVARALTWGADEKVLLVLAVAGWLASRGRSDALRRAGNHALLVTTAASLLPHGLKKAFDQTRPDRRTIVGHLRGISLSGKREDAFPSGHALHMGALASAASALPAGPRQAIRAIAVGLSLTRIVVLAHWASDTSSRGLRSKPCSSGLCECGRATRSKLPRRETMPILEDLKEDAERGTGWQATRRVCSRERGRRRSNGDSHHGFERRDSDVPADRS
jgi:hypothetical protein